MGYIRCVHAFTAAFLLHVQDVEHAQFDSREIFVFVEGSTKRNNSAVDNSFNTQAGLIGIYRSALSILLHSHCNIKANYFWVGSETLSSFS